MVRTEQSSAWVVFDQYKDPVRINVDGVVEKLNPKTGEWVKANIVIRGRPRASVGLRTKDNKRIEVPVTTLMADAFMGGRKPNMNIIHSNGSKLDCSLRNLVEVSNRMCGKLYGGCRRRPVMKLDRDGNVLAIYKSCKEAAKANFISATAVYHRCHNKLKDPFKLDGHNYQFER